MKILALQLKRIGDLVLTTPSLAAIKAWRPDCHVALGVRSSTAGLLPLIQHVDSAIVFGARRGWAPWQQVLTGDFDIVLDFTGTHRSALATSLSRAPWRTTFGWVRDKGLRRLAFTDFVESSVRERHTIDHYLDLARALTGSDAGAGDPQLNHPDGNSPRPAGKTIVIHPFTARAEKNWSAEAWGDVIAYLAHRGRACVLTGGDSFREKEHHRKIIDASGGIGVRSLAGKTTLHELCALIADAALVISCDTAAVHLAAAYHRPQIALFGPTNPFHWRPRHDGATVISASNPEAPLTQFEPRLKGVQMERISTETVCRAIDALLAP